MKVGRCEHCGGVIIYDNCHYCGKELIRTGFGGRYRVCFDCKRKGNNKRANEWHKKHRAAKKVDKSTTV